MAKTNKYYILKTLQEIDLIQKYSQGLSVSDLEKVPF